MLIQHTYRLAALALILGMLSSSCAVAQGESDTTTTSALNCDNTPRIITRLDADQDGVISKAEFPGPDAAFERVDADHDGSLTADELKTSRLERLQQRGQRAQAGGNVGQNWAARPGMNAQRLPGRGQGQQGPQAGRGTGQNRVDVKAVFDLLDADQDGSLSAEEFERGAKLVQRIVYGANNAQAQRGMRGAGMAGMQGQRQGMQQGFQRGFQNNGPIGPQGLRGRQGGPAMNGPRGVGGPMGQGYGGQCPLIQDNQTPPPPTPDADGLGYVDEPVDDDVFAGFFGPDTGSPDDI
ncbi:EF-hand domain-containing protein [Candidatus Sumerlaeota bacterium]|nr:EF-hand domain-containing protein [Candidatus Sumerlaeota bacterium]